MKRMIEGRRLLLAVVVGLAVLLGGLAWFRASYDARGPFAGTWQVVSVQEQGGKSIDIRPLHATLTVDDGAARFTDDINTYRATFDEPRAGEISVSNVSATAVGRAGPGTAQQQAVDLLEEKVFTTGTFAYRTAGHTATITRDGVTIHFVRH